MSLKPIYKDLVLNIQESLKTPYFKTLCKSPRITSLPGLLRRHGVTLTCFFLRSKDDADQKLLQLLDICLEAVGKPTSIKLTQPDTIVKLEAYQIIRLQEQALEAAVWIQRIAAAKNEFETTEKQSSSGRDEEGDDQ